MFKEIDKKCKLEKDFYKLAKSKADLFTSLSLAFADVAVNYICLSRKSKLIQRLMILFIFYWISLQIWHWDQNCPTYFCGPGFSHDEHHRPIKGPLDCPPDDYEEINTYNLFLYCRFYCYFFVYLFIYLFWPALFDLIHCVYTMLLVSYAFCIPLAAGGLHWSCMYQTTVAQVDRQVGRFCQVSLSVCLPLGPSVFLPISLSVWLAVCRSVSLSVCRSVGLCLFVCPFVRFFFKFFF